MSRDYAKSQHKEHKPLPGWLWLLAGLLIGLFVALLVYIKDNTSGKLTITDTVAKVFQKRDTDTRAVTKQQAPPAPTAKPESTKPKFDFYTILPELEVAIPEQDLVNESAQPQDKQSSVQNYILQAGSFRQDTQADQLKARLALEGIVAHIQKVKINDNDTWYRVRIGPIADLSTLNQTRRRLKKMGIVSIVVKNKS